MKISENELEQLKENAERLHSELDFKFVDTRASAYLAIETIRQLRNNLRNSIIMVILGGILGFVPNYIIEYNRKQDAEKERIYFQQQLKKLQLQLNHYQIYHSKKDSL